MSSGDQAKIRLLIVQTAVGDYRQGLLDVLGRAHADVMLVCGDTYFDPSTVTRAHGRILNVTLRNRFIFGRRLLWQGGAIRSVLAAEALILEYNPRIISNWVFAAIGRLSGKSVVFWGHLYSRKGARSWTNRLRVLMCSLGSGFLTYTERDAQELGASGYRHPIHVAANALYSKTEMVADEVTDPEAFIYVGRLVQEKKPLLFIEAFLRVREERPSSRIIIIGDGPLASCASELLHGAGLDADGILLGHRSEYEVLRSSYGQSIFAVSPGYVGLSVTQSLGFGIPVIYPRDDPHSPEVALLDATNSLVFESDSVSALAEAMLAGREQRELWLSRRQAICEQTASKYSTESMAAGLLACAGVNS